MPTGPTQLIRASPMAVAVGPHRPGGGLKPASWSRRCRLRSFPHPDLLCLPDPSPHYFKRSRSTPCFPSSTRADEASSAATDSIACIEIAGGHSAPGVHALVVEAAVAMAFGARPVPAPSGLGDVYFLRSPAGNCLAVIKPVDEESLDLSVLSRPASRLSVRAGETGVREAAAYLLDHGAFAGVPPTALIRISHPALSGPSSVPVSRLASIQRFMLHDFDAGELGPSRFSVASVHRIGILDVRLLNTDRHAGNLLVQKQRTTSNNSFDGYGGEPTAELIPIDHGLCLPELLDYPYFEWLYWPQAIVPFSDIEAEYVSKLDPFKDAELLRAELPSLQEPAIRILIFCTIFLKRAVDAGLCLVDIGGMMTREFCRLEEGMSVLEALCKQIEDAMFADSQIADTDSCDGRGSDECKECQFIIDCEEGGVVAVEEEVLDIPLTVRGKHKKALDPLQEEEDEAEEEVEEVREETKEIGGGMMMMMTKSVSFSTGEWDCDGGRVQEGIAFKHMSEEDWRLFLERFENLLPDAFEARRRMRMNQRLGSSCNF